MWAISSIPWQASWRPPTTTKWSGSHTVSAKPRRPENKNFNDDEDGVANPKSVSIPISNNPKQLIIKGDDESDWEDKGVGGSDILWALQKASAQKVKKKKKKKREIEASSKSNGDEKRDVKAVSIRVDWSKRLDDLERRLRDLTDSSSSSSSSS